MYATWGNEKLVLFRKHWASINGGVWSVKLRKNSEEIVEIKSEERLASSFFSNPDSL